jgi:thiol-disulfide isomerase/thioredoxin
VEYRARLLLLAAAALAAVLLVSLALGVRLTGTPSESPASAPLVRPSFTTAPPLGLEVLSQGRMPAALAELWRRAARDQRVDVPELRGWPLVINFWASWCLSCRREAPLLERAWRREAGRVLFVGVNQNDALSDARAFLRRFKVSYPSLRESGYATARRWRVAGFPVTFFVAADGHVVAEAIGRLRPGQLGRGVRATRQDRLAA